MTLATCKRTPNLLKYSTFISIVVEYTGINMYRKIYNKKTFNRKREGQ